MGCLALEEGVAAERLRLSALGWRVLRTFLVGERKTQGVGVPPPVDIPLIPFSLLISSFLSLEGRKPAEG